MMGPMQEAQAALFYEFSLDDHVPQDHLLRSIDRFVDLGTIRAHLADFYSHTGRPSIDPDLLIRMLLVGYCFGIRSERRLCEEVHLNLAYRWFAEAFAAFLAQGKKARNAEITSSFARAFKSQDQNMMAIIGEKAGANIREIWDPTASNCFKRMKAAQLDELFLQLLDREDNSTEFRTFKKLKKREKDQKMHELFHDVDVQAIYKVSTAQKARIDAWTPACF